MARSMQGVEFAKWSLCHINAYKVVFSLLVIYIVSGVVLAATFGTVLLTDYLVSVQC